VSSLTVSEPIPTHAHGQTQTILQAPSTVYQSATFEDALLQLVKHDPFASISELRTELSLAGQFGKVGWWRTYFVLRRHHLVKKRSRFNYARGRR
jgi:hypothetical protein